MKRMRISLPFLFLGLLPLTLASGQDKKNEEKIKIVIADKEGSKVVLDTTFTDVIKMDSLKLKDGTIFYFGNHSDNDLTGKRRIYITSPDGKNAKKISREVTVVTSDPDEPSELEEITGDNIVVYSQSGDKSTGQGKKYKVVTKVDKEGGKSEMKYFYINDDRGAGHASDDHFDVTISDEFDHNTDNTKHVIAKDGVVVTIEGSDEEQVNELVKEIEKKLDTDKDKSPAKASETKTVKKK